MSWILCTCIVATAAIAFLIDWLDYRPLNLVKSKVPLEIESVLNCDYEDNVGLGVLLARRAKPNAWLAKAFRVDNAFTTTDVTKYREFKKMAISKTNTSNEKWTQYSNKATEFSQNMLQRSRGTVCLSAHVQILVMKTNFFMLFDLETPTEMDNCLLKTARTINTIWVHSRRPGSLLGPKESIDELDALLKMIFKSSPNPGQWVTAMNLIIPAYETMWRVVLRCFLETALRIDNCEDWRQAFKLYTQNPSPIAFKYRHFMEKHKDQSVEMAVLEALRLYPPTKRLYRHIEAAGGRKEKIVKVDIEAIHRSKEYWGEKALEFRPSRWRGLDENPPHFIPFGCLRMRCPAAKQFGPRMIGLLVAVLHATIGPINQKNGIWNTGSGDWSFLFHSEPLYLDRLAYEDLQLARSQCS